MSSRRYDNDNDSAISSILSRQDSYTLNSRYNSNVNSNGNDNSSDISGISSNATGNNNNNNGNGTNSKRNKSPGKLNSNRNKKSNNSNNSVASNTNANKHAGSNNTNNNSNNGNNGTNGVIGGNITSTYHSGRVKVGVRCRPPFQDEIDSTANKEHYYSIIETISPNPNDINNPNSNNSNNQDPLACVSLSIPTGKTRDFMYDFAFHQDATQDIVYDALARPVVSEVLAGFNGTIFACK